MIQHYVVGEMGFLSIPPIFMIPTQLHRWLELIVNVS